MPAIFSGTDVVWSPALGLSSTTLLNPELNSTETATYILIGTDANGCIAKDTVLIEIGCNSLKVPQAFTPNSDGVNDHFTVFGDVKSYEIRIFNRWGELVYNSQDESELNDLNRGWDGTYKGALQQIGTFVYYITARDFSNKLIEKKGNLTLIR